MRGSSFWKSILDDTQKKTFYSLLRINSLDPLIIFVNHIIYHFFFFGFWWKKQFLIDLQIRQHSHFLYEVLVPDMGNEEEEEAAQPKQRNNQFNLCLPFCQLLFTLLVGFAFSSSRLGTHSETKRRKKKTDTRRPCVQNKYVLSRFCTCFFLFIHTRSYRQSIYWHRFFLHTFLNENYIKSRIKTRICTCFVGAQAT